MAEVTTLIPISTYDSMSATKHLRRQTGLDPSQDIHEQYARAFDEALSSSFGASMSLD